VFSLTASVFLRAAFKKERHVEIRSILPIPHPRCSAYPEQNIQVLHVPDWMVNDSPEMPYPWADGPEREEIMDAFVARPRR
jgi:hypothetical protein